MKEVKVVEVKKEQRACFKYGYSDFGVAPISRFDFLNYKGNWCRYCGSRFTKIFKKGPWGKVKLCYHHYISWKKKKLDLSKFKKEPK